jgi:hypothetical protein
MILMARAGAFSILFQNTQQSFAWLHCQARPGSAEHHRTRRRFFGFLLPF